MDGQLYYEHINRLNNELLYTISYQQSPLNWYHRVNTA